MTQTKHFQKFVEDLEGFLSTPVGVQLFKGEKFDFILI